ncbi:vesicle transport through interaction with t-SNAREs homolog 1A [Halyomorpha halys]|uniref:vesicle transport through interaction with t-SNAREs homolog 1A n=1 Tax=Halyomorpha halys TaxID=286706 RepID=UPI0006D4ECAC|nr:uncharacterized protein LOC106686453 [Halyomorpha halys]
MASQLEQYEEQYATSTADFTAKISKLSKVKRSTKRELLEQLQKHAEDLRELVGHMEVEGCVDPTLKPRVECYRTELERLEKELSSVSIKKKSSSVTIFPDYAYLHLK